MAAATRIVLEQPAMPWLVGLLAIGIAVFTWGGFDPVSVFHDEAAYLLQAALFAHGRVVGGAPPIPAFFEQFHVLLSPGVAPKYPPGFALTMVPGVWLGMPALMPIVLTGLTAGFGFALMRRVAGGPCALLAILIWAGAPGNLRFRAAYFSELLTSLLWILAWWALLHWRARHRLGWLVALAMLVGFAAITRPLTALVLAVPLAVVILPETLRRLPSLAAALAAGTAVVFLLPLQNRLVTGSWRSGAYAAYTAAYLPFDRIGFGLDSTPPTRELPADMRALSGFFSRLHREHTRAHLPSTMYQRASAILTDAGGPTVVGAVILGGMGLAAAPPTVLFAAVTTALLFAAHLPYAHSADWTLYYLEGFPVLALLMSLGIARIGTLLSRARAPAITDGPGDALVIGASIVFALLLPTRILAAREAHRGLSAAQAYFRELVRELPGPSIVFVRYGPKHVMHFSLIQNPADYGSAHVWVVYDRGAENTRLLVMAPGRRPYLYDEAGLELVPLDVPAGRGRIPQPSASGSSPGSP